MAESPYESPAEVADETREPKLRRPLTWRKMTIWSVGASGLALVVLALIPERFTNPPEPRPNELDVLRAIAIGVLMLCVASTFMCGLRWLMNEDAED
jgi:hypothetical protein